MTRGFVTLATGDVRYYKMAFNLLRSFRLFDPDTPFAILCDRHNEYTSEFTDVVVIDNPTNSYLDKFLLLLKCPYDENIFIEPDCLVYRSLDSFWELLSGEYDFTSFGWNDGTLVFFQDPEYASQKFLNDPQARVPLFNPGYLFIRNGETCRRIYRDAMDVIAQIKNDPKMNQDPELICKGSIRDDPVFFVAMAMNDCRCSALPNEGKCVFLPGATEIMTASLSKGRLDADWHGKLTDCRILHFSSRRAKEEGLYWQQEIVLDLIYKGAPRLCISFAESRPVRFFAEIYKKVTVGVRRKLRRN